MIKKFRKKPVVIEAIQYTGVDSVIEIQSLNGSRDIYFANPEDSKSDLLINTLEGVMRANKNDWIIKGISGELYPCKPDIFEQTYEEVE